MGPSSASPQPLRPHQRPLHHKDVRATFMFMCGSSSACSCSCWRCSSSPSTGWRTLSPPLPLSLTAAARGGAPSLIWRSAASHRRGPPSPHCRFEGGRTQRIQTHRPKCMFKCISQCVDATIVMHAQTQSTQRPSDSSLWQKTCPSHRQHGICFHVYSKHNGPVLQFAWAQIYNSQCDEVILKGEDDLTLLKSLIQLRKMNPRNCRPSIRKGLMRNFPLRFCRIHLLYIQYIYCRTNNSNWCFAEHVCRLHCKIIIIM